MFYKIPKTLHDKAVQSNRLWLNLNKINVISSLQSEDKQGNPSFHLAQNADTHALKQNRLSQNISPACSSFVLLIASDMHLEPESNNNNKKKTSEKP